MAAIYGKIKPCHAIANLWHLYGRPLGVRERTRAVRPPSFSAGKAEIADLRIAPFISVQCYIECNHRITIMMYSDGVFGGFMMWDMGLLWLLVLVFLVTGIAAFIKYLSS